MELGLRHPRVDADVGEHEIVEVALGVGDDALADVERARIDTNRMLLTWGCGTLGDSDST